jgi:hypothetical protein
MLDPWHHWLTGVRLLFFRDPMDFRHPGAVWERLAVAGHARRDKDEEFIIDR